jgi:hypothetical protein
MNKPFVVSKKITGARTRKAPDYVLHGPFRRFGTSQQRLAPKLPFPTLRDDVFGTAVAMVVSCRDRGLGVAVLICVPVR